MRGEVWTIAGADLSKPRPAVIVQSDRCASADTVLVCPLTSFDAGGGDRLLPNSTNGLKRPSRPMAHRMAAIKKARLGECIGVLSDDEMSLVCDCLRFVLEL